jgi:hypothetical protein
MLKIQGKEKLVGWNIEVGDAIWKVEGVYEYPQLDRYQIHLRTEGNPDKVFTLTEEELFVEGNAKYKISDSDNPFNSMWVNVANISTITSMLRTLKRIISHANN